jgi:DNA helicase-4
MSLTNKEIQLALTVSKNIEEYLLSTGKTNLRASDIFQHLERKGLFERDSKKTGIHFYRFLKKLKKENMLHLIPQCDGIDQNEIYTNWFFHRALKDLDKGKASPNLEWIKDKSPSSLLEETMNMEDTVDEDSKKNNPSPLIEDLNDEQKKAVFHEAKSLLVLAGAGSGKTKTLIQKVLYLVFEKNVEPSSILAITFTKNAANEMIDRLISAADTTGKYQSLIADKQISMEEKERARNEYMNRYKWISSLNIKTFHAFCYSLIRQHGGDIFDSKFRLIANSKGGYEIEDVPFEKNEDPAKIIDKVIRELSKESEFLLKVKQYILDYYVNSKKNIKKKSNYDTDLKYITLRGDKVRSKSERLIADWLYRHEIDYTYEKDVNLSFPFNPDFYIPEADLYLEHKSNRSAPLSDKAKELKKAGKNLEVTYEEDTRDEKHFFSILDEIFTRKINREIRPVSNLKFEIEFDSLLQNLQVFIEYGLLKAMDMIKVEGRDINAVCELGLNNKHKRIREFYQILKKVSAAYNKYCIDHSYLDFNDLIIQGNALMSLDKSLREYYSEHLRYILVDEFQDVNNLQVELLKSLISDNNQLFCVGDDWQSIYGFRGSDVEYIINFEQYFKNSTTIKLGINYRSNDTIVNASTDFILHNKNLVKKEIRSFHKKGKKINLYLAQDEKEDGAQIVYDYIVKLSKAGYTKEDILVLYRRHRVFNDMYYEKLKSIVKLYSRKTIHAAKGLEAKAVFIIGLTGDTHGFPFLMESESLFQVIKEAKVDRLREEERRLFYVALTRAKNHLFLVSELGNQSEFIRELKEEYFERRNFLTLTFSDNNKCPQCSYTIKDGYMFCPMCGSQIYPEDDKIIHYKSDLAPALEVAEQKVILQVGKNLPLSIEKDGVQVIRCMNAIQKGGRSILCKTLHGSKSINGTLTRIVFYGIFKKYTQKEIMSLIDELISKRFMKIEDDGYYPLLSITKEGKELLSEYELHN